MTSYAEQIMNAAGQTLTRTIPDNEVKAYFAPQVQLSANKLTFTADGVDFVAITAQLKSVPLSDDSRVSLSLVQKIVLLISEVAVELTTDANGLVMHEIAANDAGAYIVSVQNLSSNTLTLQAV